MYNKVFISYAREDFSAAERLFDYLIQNRFDPWLDKKKLLPGQNWNIEIRQALKKADFIILLLSKTSIIKRGYFQREFKLALNYLEEKLDSDIYIIPCRIDDCKIPERLSEYHWIELNKPDSFDSILNSLNLQRKKNLEMERKKISANTTFEFNEITVAKEVGEKPKNSIEITYPKFVDVNNEDLKLINTFIEYVVFKTNNEFLSPLEPSAGPINSVDYPLPDNNLSISYKIELINNNFISITLFTYEYTGGAHGNYGTVGYNYRLNPFIELTIQKIFNYEHNVLETLRSICKKKLLNKAEREYEIKDEKHFFLNEIPLEPKWETFSNFYLKKDSIVIIFGIYQETAYALGEHEVEIKFDELLRVHQNLKSLEKIKQLLKE